MNTKLIMIEGIPGSGKSTFAQKIAEYYKDKGTSVNLFIEGQAHPADLAWSAYVPLGLFHSLLSKYSDLENEIRQNSYIYDNYAVIAYTQIHTENRDFYNQLENYEVYNKRVPFDIFCNLHFSRWEEFGKQATVKNELNIFECAFFQNHINELQNFHLVNKTEIKLYLDKLISTVLDLSPTLIYLNQSNIRETIQRIAKERVSEHGNWLDMAITYVENSPYGKLNGLYGFDGLVQIMEARKEIELEIIKSSPIKSIVIENDAYDWNKCWQDIESFLRIV